MPENASTRTTYRDRLRSRPVSPRSAGGGASAAAAPDAAAVHAAARQSRPAQFEQSPVLFRLPAIGPAESDDFAATAESPHGPAPHSSVAHRDRSEPRGDDEVALDIPRGAAPPAEVQQAASPQAASQPTAVEAAEQLQLQPLPSGPTEVLPVEAPPEIAAAAAAETSAEQRRTWWEHWSSGVVLILLVIALVVASIIALNDGSKLKSDQMAGETDTLGLDEFDLPSIAIPDISMPPLNVAAGRPLSANDQKPPISTNLAEPAAAAALAVGDSPVADLAATDSSQPGQAAADISATNSSPTNSSAAEPLAADKLAADNSATTQLVAEQPVPDGQAPDAAGQAATAQATAATAGPQASAPLATLDRPTEVAVPQLFAQPELPGDPASAAGTHRVSSMPANTPSVSLELPRTEVTQAEGSSPTFYDGAFLAGEQQAVSGATVPVDTNLPSISTVLASATAKAEVEVDTAPAAPVASATPDLNGQSIVEAYLEFRRLHETATEAASNRHPDHTPPH